MRLQLRRRQKNSKDTVAQPRQITFSKGINVQNLQHPQTSTCTRQTQTLHKPRFRQPQVSSPTLTATATASISSSNVIGIGGRCIFQTTPPLAAVMSLWNSSASASCPATSGRSVKEAATSRIKELCMDIIQSAEEGTSSPQRAEIKKVIAQYHQSRGQAVSPRDPNFTEIPPEYSTVLTYGLARSQAVSKAATVSNAYAPVFESGSRSRFAEIKHTLK